MKIYLCAREDDLFQAWKTHFDRVDSVEVTKQDILHIKAEGLVSPANSFGNMSGGVDLVYRNYFGKRMEERLREIIIRQFEGELLVGQATWVPIEHPSYTYSTLISAPTMRVPCTISHTINVYLATKAALNLAIKLGLGSITFPGMGTGTGGVSAISCAKQMRQAYSDVSTGYYNKTINIYEEQNRMVKNIVSKEWLEAQYK